MLSGSLNGGCPSQQLPNETWHAIVNELSGADQLNLALSCRRFYRLVRKQVLGVGTPKWIDAPLRSSTHGGPPAAAYRNAVMIRDTIYLPVLSNSEATCWILDLLRYPTEWISVPIVHADRSFRPVLNPAVTSLDTSVYVFGGDDVLSGIPTNSLYEINTNMSLRLLCANGPSPTPRSMASLDVLDSHHLVLFGGRCLMPNGYGKCYDTRELCIYDIAARRWHAVPVPSISNFPTPRSLHSTTTLAGRLYVYGGESVTSFSGTRVHEDVDLHCWDYRGKWLKFLSAAPDELSGLCLPPEWLPTKGHGPEPRRGACLFALGRSGIAIVGGNMPLPRANERPWEYMYILNPDVARYARVRVKNLPRMDCVCFAASSTNSVFVLGVDPEHRHILSGHIVD